MQHPVIKIKDLWFSFNGPPILKDVSFEVREKDFLAVIGPNGGGKTTLIKLMLGLLKADQGNISILGMPPQEASHRIGYVSQEVITNKHFPISVLDVVMMGRLCQGRRQRWYSKKDRAATEKALEQVEMWNYRKSLVGELSGGQQQRVSIARALVSEPEILFLDEPTASIDTKGQTNLFYLLKEFNKNITIVVVTHDISIISTYVKCVACVNRRVFYHDSSEITGEMLDMAYTCPVELVAHGLPHRVLKEHD